MEDLYLKLNDNELNTLYKILNSKKPDSPAEEDLMKDIISKVKTKPGIDDTDIIDMAAEVFIRNAITQAADNALFHLQSLLGIDDGGFHPGTAIYVDEHLETLVKDYCDIFSDQRMNARM